MSIVNEINEIYKQSKYAWEIAILTAGEEYLGGSKEKAAEMQSLADDSNQCYEAAIEYLEGQYADWERLTRSVLEEARSLESKGGDASDAISALEAFEEYLEEEQDPI